MRIEKARMICVLVGLSWAFTGTGLAAGAPANSVSAAAQPQGTSAPASEIKGSKKAVQALIQEQKAIGQMSAQFTLKIIGAGKDGKDFSAQGNIWLASGRRYAVQYEQPERQRLVSNGAKRWLYLEKINQVQVQSLPPAGNPSEFFLELGGGLPALIERCQVKVLPALEKVPGSRGYLLTPRPGENLDFAQAQIWVAGKQGKPVRAIVEAARRVEVDFQNVKLLTAKQLKRDPNQGLASDFFEFQAPPDAEVIDAF